MYLLLVSNEAVQVLKLVLILLRAFSNFLCSILYFKPIIYCQFTALELMRSSSLGHSQKSLWENQELR